ncbi:MAG TPA: 1-(5-phosphoribosyl)-5-[(5-phosphoribosylamino)methylideneamino] imidazole-4-carboxamide isomerase [Rhodanobacteraceae bacterium]|nr:1-(5-phosphoribosyl)-5-[(5-phosphoribosylamino)methylideneamino] imidazole-4-carboxamide isomerase [Rhodanobacteraceae bacterium]
MNDFTVIPAIDLRGGHVVRLLKGDYERQTDYAVEPLALAENYAALGAEWLHVVDLDGARAGAQTHLDTLKAMAGTGLKLQAGGGIRSEDDIKRLFDVGVSRAVIGSLAMREPERVAKWIERHGADRLTLALDARCRNGVWRLTSAGWTSDEDVALNTLASFYAKCGARHVLSTDIDRDGAMTGPNIDLYTHLARAFPILAVQASGGVRSGDDVRAVRASGAAGVILGRALLEGKLELADALVAGSVTSC